MMMKQKDNKEFTIKPNGLSSSETKFMCQCNYGHVFDYRDRIRFSKNDKHYAPCQGMCPVCKTTLFTRMVNNVTFK